MPGIAGVLRRSNRDVNIENLLIKMCQEMKHEDWYSTNIFSKESIGLARVSLGIFNPEPQPIFNEDKSICIMMDGEIYDYQKSKDELINRGHEFVVDNDPEFILHLYEEYGKDFISQLNGSFVLTIWDNKKQELLIANDRYGLRPLYYAEHKGYLLFSSEMKAILKDDSFERIVDDRAVSDFLSFRFILGTKTFLQGISLLPAASIMTCDASQISIKKYWDFNFQEDGNHPEEYYTEHLSKLTQQAVERRLKGNCTIGASISGGFDTRMVVANIAKKHSPIHTYTYGGANCKEAVFAPIVAKKLGTSHHFFEYKPEDFISAVENGGYLLGEIVDPNSFGVINRLKEIRTFMDVEVSGIGGGEILRGACITHQMESATNEEQLFQAMCNYVYKAIPEELLNEEWHKKIKGASMSCFKSLYSKYHDENLLSRSEHFFICESLPSYARSAFMLNNSQFERREPFFDNDLIDFIQTIPVSLRKNSYILTKVLLGMFPDIANISFEAAGCPVYVSRFHAVKGILKRLFKRITGILFGVYRNNNYRFVDYSRWLRDNQQVQEQVREILLSQKAKARPYFKPEITQKILEDQFSGRKENWGLITRLITIELWHRTFLDE